MFKVTISGTDTNKTINVGLPIESKDLISLLSRNFPEENYYISDVENTFGITLNEYNNIYLLNEFAKLLAEKNVPAYVVCVLSSLEDGLEEIFELVRDENYKILYNNLNVADEETVLGMLLYENSLLPMDIPAELVQAGYIDFKRIGRDACISENWIKTGDYFARKI